MNETFRKLKSLAGIMGLVGVLFLGACSSDEGTITTDEPEPEVPETAKGYYFNPVIRRSIPDPTCIRANDGMYYLYGTEDIWNMPIFRSADMVNWDQVGTVFTAETRPTEPEGASLWAPEIRYMKGKYVIFYSLARMNNSAFSTIGYAVSDRPEGPFTVRGIIGNSASLGIRDCIDPFIWEEDGEYYFMSGSYSQLALFNLDVADDLSYMIPDMSSKKVLGGNWFEASAIWKHDGYYYMFASIGFFGFGVGNPYETVVGRSSSLRGPYMTRSGRRMTDNNYELLITGDSKFSDTGHCSILMEDDAKNPWIIYHGYQLADTGRGRCIFLDRIYWDEDGWPYVKGRHPSSSAERPVINK